MYPNPSKQKPHQQKVSGTRLQRFLLPLLLISLSAFLIGLLVIWQFWRTSNNPQQHPTPSPIVTHTPQLSPTPSLSPPALNLTQRIDTYIQHLTQTQQIGQLLMLSVYANNYSPALDQPLKQWDIANIIIYNQYNGGP